MESTEQERRAAFERILSDLRPKLHRYCARMTGSVIAGEDVVQEALVKALEAFPATESIVRVEGWLFRVAHNTALDFLRRRARLERLQSDEDPDMTEGSTPDAEQRQIAATSLRTFMRLPPSQRSTVILMDVLGHSLEEIGEVMNATLPSVKASLHRGRMRLRELGGEPEEPPAALDEGERALLEAYVDRFNAHDFDAVREMLAREVQLEVVNRVRRNGKAEVSSYFTNYSKTPDWQLAPGLVDGESAVLVYDRDAPAEPLYFILVEWFGDRVLRIRDFRYARYVMDGAVLKAL